MHWGVKKGSGWGRLHVERIYHPVEVAMVTDRHVLGQAADMINLIEAAKKPVVRVQQWVKWALCLHASECCER